jgi:hypothetical protein
VVCALTVLELKFPLNKIKFFGLHLRENIAYTLYLNLFPKYTYVCELQSFFNVMSSGTHLYLCALESSKIIELFGISKKNNLHKCQVISLLFLGKRILPREEL